MSWVFRAEAASLSFLVVKPHPREKGVVLVTLLLLCPNIMTKATYKESV